MKFLESSLLEFKAQYMLDRIIMLIKHNSPRLILLPEVVIVQALTSGKKMILVYHTSLRQPLVSYSHSLRSYKPPPDVEAVVTDYKVLHCSVSMDCLRVLIAILSW